MQDRTLPALPGVRPPFSLLGRAYPPCLHPFSDLSKISLADLKLDTHHHGHYLLLRTFCQPLGVGSPLLAAIEDERGGVDRLACFNVKVALKASDVLPEGSVVGVKEPYYCLGPDEKWLVRVDHASDLVVLEEEHELFPKQWKAASPKTAMVWKLEGNAALAREKFLEAHRCYTRALAATEADAVDLKRDIYRNRSQASLRLGHYDATISDAFWALTNEQDQASKIKDAKAHFRRGLANYRLGHFSSALRSLSQALELSPSDKQVIAEKTKTEKRLGEQNGGVYDFAEIIEEVTKNGFVADRASFTSKTEVRESAEYGRGLFATQAISMGDLILCEKAFVVAHETVSGTKNSSPALWRSCIEKVTDNPSLGRGLFNLYAGEPLPSTPTSIPIIDGKPIVDMMKISEILKHNIFSYTVGREARPYGTSAMTTTHEPKSLALFLRASLANHNCLFNTKRSFIGDLIIFRATKDIPKDAEITIAYLDPGGADNDLLQDTLFKNLGFRCGCLVCQTEAKRTTDRKSLVQRMRTFLSSQRVGPMFVRQAEALAVELEEAYSLHLSLGLPCVCVSPIWQWLCQEYFLLGDRYHVERCAMNVLKVHGYKVETEGSKVSLDATYGFPSMAVVGALSFLSRMYERDGNVALSQEFETLAKTVYKIENGTPIGYDLRY
ncbi:hypothetical protein D6C92_08965 [Aureobasidium pullulans]|nr:hypothetical protein D6C92_08965 [Aureobasidium pullulans]